jgi:hypothetical protein
MDTQPNEKTNLSHANAETKRPFETWVSTQATRPGEGGRFFDSPPLCVLELDLLQILLQRGGLRGGDFFLPTKTPVIPALNPSP